MLSRLVERWQIAVAGLMIVAGLAGGVWRMEDTRHDADERIRDEARKRSLEVCEGTNRALASSRAGFDRFRDVLVGVATEGEPSTSEQREQIAAFNALIDREVLAGLDPVDCEALADS